MSAPVRVAAHPLLDAIVFDTVFARAVGEIGSVASVVELLSPNAAANAEASGRSIPVRSNDDIRSKVRELLRHGGYKPTGRGKPASEYLLRAVGEGALGSINVAVDACNAVSFHSGLPISVIDSDRAKGALSIAISAAGESYVFNAGGQTIDVSGLLCLRDEDGPCANAVKDAQRTKTNAETRRTTTVIWGTNAVAGHTAATFAWYKALLEELGASVELRELVQS